MAQPPAEIQVRQMLLIGAEIVQAHIPQLAAAPAQKIADHQV
jgi:hypothetical protein